MRTLKLHFPEDTLPTLDSFLTLQRHFSALPKFAHVDSRFCGRKRRGAALFDVPINPCVRDACSKSVAVGLEKSRDSIPLQR